MKVRFVRDLMVENPEWDRRQAALHPNTYAVPQYLPKPKGTILEHADAYMLVIMGNAIAEDDECREKLSVMGVTDADILDSQAKQDAYQGIEFEGEDDE